MSEPFRGTINVDIRDSESDWAPFEPPKAPQRSAGSLILSLFRARRSLESALDARA